VLWGSAGAEPSPPIEYETYSKYSFSIEYPKGLTITEEGLYEATATDTSGVVAGISYDPFEEFTVSWEKRSTPATREDFENALNDVIIFADYEKTGTLIETTKLGHLMLYQQYVYPEESQAKSFILGVWYCDIDEKIYYLGYRQATEHDVLQIFERYLDSFVCH
jgi:hypothetical protein